MSAKRADLAMASQLRYLIEEVLNKLEELRDMMNEARQEALKKKLTARAKGEIRSLEVMKELEKLALIVGEDAALEGLALAERGGVRLLASSGDLSLLNKKKLAEKEKKERELSPDIFEDTPPPSTSDAEETESNEDRTVNYIPRRPHPQRFYEVNAAASSQRVFHLFETAEFCPCETFRSSLISKKLPFCRHCVGVWLAKAFDWVVQSPTQVSTLTVIHDQFGERLREYY